MKKTPEQRSPWKRTASLLTGKQAVDKFAENYANESKIPISKERDQGKNSQQNSCESHASAPQTW